MLDGIPLGSAGWVMGNGEGQAKGVSQRRLEFGFPGAATAAVAATGVAQNEHVSRSWVTEGSLLLPPTGDGMRGKGRCVMRDSDNDGASISEQVIDAIRDGDAGGIGAEIMIIDR